MRTLCSALLVLVTTLALASCDKLLDPLNNGGTQGPARYLFFKYTEIPASMTNDAAIAQIHDTRSNFIRSNFTQKIFPVTDSMVVGAYMLALNRLVVYQQPGRAEVYGGEDGNIHPPQPGIPSLLQLNVSDGDDVGVLKTLGDWRIEFNGGNIVATGGANDFMEYTLESFDASQFHGTGRFAFIATNESNPQQRWAIFDGEFALTKGRN